MKKSEGSKSFARDAEEPLSFTIAFTTCLERFGDTVHQKDIGYRPDTEDQCQNLMAREDGMKSSKNDIEAQADKKQQLPDLKQVYKLDVFVYYEYN